MYNQKGGTNVYLLKVMMKYAIVDDLKEVKLGTIPYIKN